MQILRHVYCMNKAKLLHCIYPSNTMSIFFVYKLSFKIVSVCFFLLLLLFLFF